MRYTLKTPYGDGTTHLVFAPLDFMARLAALVPRPRAHLTRYHGGVRAPQRMAGRGHAGRLAPGDDVGPAAEAGLRH